MPVVNNNLPNTNSERKWHALNTDDILRELDANPAGLDDKEAEHRLSRYGPNLLTGRKKTPVILILLHQFANPLVYILLAAAVVKFTFKGVLDGSVILGVLFFMALIGFVQEMRARKAMESLLH